MLKVSLIAAGAAPAVIFDETKPRPSDYCLDGFHPEPSRQFQNTPLIRGAAPFVADRYNMTVTWTCRVTHTFLNTQTCQDFIGNRPALPRVGELQVYFAFAGSIWIRYYKSAFLTQIKPIKTFPVSVDYSYTFLLNSLFSLTP